jgi:hypothetical protein
MSFRLVPIALLLPLLLPTSAVAQGPFETAGTRALGMGGAFVAVADDATATFWNPAGLSTLRFFDGSLERTTIEADVPEAGADRRWSTDDTRLSLALPVVAFTYARQRIELPSLPTAGLAPGRQDQQIEAVARTFRVQHFGLTLVQSLGDAVVVGSTVRLVRAGVGDAENRFDADIGALASFGRLRLGLAVRNLTAPEFEAELPESWRIRRQARVGASIGGEPARGQRPWAAALDVDLTRTTLAGSERRSLAAGAERWLSNRRFAVRGGARVQTVGDLRPAASGGASVAIRSGVLIETQATGGSDAADRGWSVSARLTF